jgi:hypothetical protein
MPSVDGDRDREESAGQHACDGYDECDDDEAGHGGLRLFRAVASHGMFCRFRFSESSAALT